MRILFDQGTSAPLRGYLAGHQVSTAFEQGWSELSNGDLLRAAENLFELFVATDRNLRYQQNLTGRKLAIIVLPTTSWPLLQKHLAEIVAAVLGIRASEFRELSFLP